MLTEKQNTSLINGGSGQYDVMTLYNKSDYGDNYINLVISSAYITTLIKVKLYLYSII